MNRDGSQPRIEIDMMELDDLEAVVCLENDSFASPWPVYSFENSIDHPDVDALVARGAGSIQGFLVAAQKGNEYLIANVAVSKDCRRKGLGTRLLERALELGEARGTNFAILDVRETNGGAIQLYQSLGFRFAQKIKGYYSSPSEDALVMVKKL
jgi:ribosomal-protein-alanine N-acetyltransferase